MTVELLVEFSTVYNATRMASVGSSGSRVLLVGERNPYSDDPSMALWVQPRNAAGARLQRVLGLGVLAYLGCWRTNLCTMRWDNLIARANAGDLVGTTGTGGRPPPPWDVVVCLGRRVAGAFGVAVGLGSHGVPTWDYAEAGRFKIAAIPHPSGLCREWNAPGAVEKARRLMVTLAPDVPWGEATRDDSRSPLEDE